VKEYVTRTDVSTDRARHAAEEQRRRNRLKFALGELHGTLLEIEKTDDGSGMGVVSALVQQQEVGSGKNNDSKRRGFRASQTGIVERAIECIQSQRAELERLRRTFAHNNDATDIERNCG